MKTERFKTAALALAGLLVMTAYGKSELDLGASTSDTPYDRYMQPMRHVLESTGSRSPSLAEVNELMRTGRSFHYEYTQPYVAAAPAVTAARGAGDCKDKTLWLAQQMGSNDVRFVVGLREPHATKMHAWLLWQKSGQYFVLDCTYFSQPLPLNSLLPGEYIPKYSWSSTGEYRHTGAESYQEQIAARAKTHSPDQYQLASQAKSRLSHQSQIALLRPSPANDRQRIATQRKPQFRNDFHVVLRKSSPLADRHPVAGRRKPHFHDRYPIALRQVVRADARHRKPSFHDRYQIALREPVSNGTRHHRSSQHKPGRERHPLVVLLEPRRLAIFRDQLWQI